MKKWYAKELSQLAQVSVRTLHYYDKIGLLKPSLRQSNNYRLYSEEDLLKLQQIIALKFFGFRLSQIRSLLDNSADIFNSFSMQREYLKTKAMALLQAETLLEQITQEHSYSKSISWQKVLHSIGVYQMIQQLEESWVKHVLSEKELKSYTELEQEVKHRFSQSELIQFQKNWTVLWKKLGSSLHENPSSETGVALAEQMLNVLRGLYGHEHLFLHVKILKGIEKAEQDEKEELPIDSIVWARAAIDAYWHHRIKHLFAEKDAMTEQSFHEAWAELVEEHYGFDDVAKESAFKDAIEAADQEIKKWLQKWYHNYSSSDG